MLSSSWWCVRGPEWPQKLTGKGFAVCLRTTEINGADFAVIQCTIGTEHIMKGPQKCLYSQHVPFKPEKGLYLNNRCAEMRTSPSQRSLPLCTSIVSLGLSLSSPILDFPGHTPLHCAVLAHNALLREQGCQMLTEEQQKKLQHQREELESCIHLLVQTGASIYSRVRNQLNYMLFFCM